MTGYGASPVSGVVFIVETIRDHLTRTACASHQELPCRPPSPSAPGGLLRARRRGRRTAGPSGGLLLVNDAELAKRIEAIAYPGLTANFDAGKTAALAQTMLDWTVAGPAYGGAMVDTARALADRLVAAGLPVFRSIEGVTGSHQFDPTVPPLSNAA